MSEYIRQLRASGVYNKDEEVVEEYQQSKQVVKMFELHALGIISKAVMTSIYHEVVAGADPEQICKERGLFNLVHNGDAVKVVKSAVLNHPEMDLTELTSFCMKELKGSANPEFVKNYIVELRREK